MEVSNVIQFTDTVIGNIDPVFEHRMSFLVNDPRSDIIKIHIMVRHIKDRAGSCACAHCGPSQRLKLPIPTLLAFFGSNGPQCAHGPGSVFYMSYHDVSLNNV